MAPASYLSLHQNRLDLTVRVLPNAKRCGIEGLWNGTYIRIALNAPPVDGKANQALCRFLADYFKVRISAITLLSGETGRQKRIAVLFSTDVLARQAATQLQNILTQN